MSNDGEVSLSGDAPAAPRASSGPLFWLLAIALIFVSVWLHLIPSAAAYFAIGFTVVAAVLILAGQEKKREKFIYVGVMMTVAAAIGQGIAIRESNRENGELRTEIGIIRSNLAGAKTTIDSSATTINTLRKELGDKADRNETLSQRLIETQRIALMTATGGDSFSAVRLVYAGPNRFNMLILNEGNYPLYDLQVRLVDLDAVPHSSQINIQNTFDSSWSKTTHLPSLSAHVGSLWLPLILLPTVNERSFNVFMDARNGSFGQTLRLKRINGEWKIATQVKRIDKRAQVLQERIDKEFPRSSDGKVVW